MESQDKIIIDRIDEAKELIPSMNVDLPLSNNLQNDVSNIVTDEELTSIYSEIMNNIREDRKQVDEFIGNFADLVINEGDSTSASKEALVSLVKIKSDIADKMSKMADLMTRIKLKDRDTYPKYLSANQNNTININSGNNKRQLLEAINKAKKEKKDEN